MKTDEHLLLQIMKDESENRLGKRKQVGLEKARHKGGEIDIEAWIGLREPARPTLKIGSESSISVRRAACSVL
ncbi:hypothetical protein J1N35_035368 [Gossypium stocksii]|uniref:Uncharacterized protein n=1 Tax=Gossypium stocksii TaxID=47602 RepID=A0A9D3UTS7_9ROSI|nr:hypothetical protein J1N35_035368 [Gossypium stocksii]